MTMYPAPAKVYMDLRGGSFYFRGLPTMSLPEWKRNADWKWDADWGPNDAGRFIDKNTGRIGSTNDALESGQAFRDTLGRARVGSTYFPEAKLQQVETRETGPFTTELAQRITVTDPNTGEIHLIRGGGPDQKTLDASITASAFETGLLGPADRGEMVDPDTGEVVDYTNAGDIAQRIRDRADVVQDITDLPTRFR